MHPNLSWDSDIMSRASPVTLPAGQAKHNTHSSDCMDCHRGAGYQYIIHIHLRTHTHTHAATHIFKSSHFIISVAGLGSHTSRRCLGLFLHCHQIPSSPPVCYLLIHIHVESDPHQRAPLPVGGAERPSSKENTLKHKYTPSNP